VDFKDEEKTVRIMEKTLTMNHNGQFKAL